jgi:hypothetical protein
MLKQHKVEEPRSYRHERHFTDPESCLGTVRKRPLEGKEKR